MRLSLHYLQLHKRFGTQETAELTLAEVAETLGCTHRTAVTIIGKLTDQGWISWSARRGRGKRSSLRFLAAPREIARASLREASSSGQLGRSLEQLAGHAVDSEAPLEAWLAAWFGHRAEISRERQVDILRLPIRERLQTIDPAGMNLLAESFIASHVYDGLVRWSEDGRHILPNLAHAWEVDEARRRWTFHLRKGVVFHDGRELTAADVVYSLERLRAPGQRSLYAPLFRQIRAVRAWTKAAVIIELDAAHELLLPLLCTSRAAIVSSQGESEPERVGTGPFKPVRLEPHLCVLEAYPNYHLGRAQLDRVEIVHVPWRAEQGQPAPAPDPHAPFHLMHHAGAAGRDWSRISPETTVRKFITCNSRASAILSDPEAREGVAAALAEQPVPRPLPQLVGAPLRLATIEPYRQDAMLIAERLVRAGYRCEVTTSSPYAFKQAAQPEADLILFALLRDRDAQLRLYDLYATMESRLDAEGAAEIERTLRAVLAETDPEARTALYEALESELVARRQLHILYEKPVEAAYLPSLRGVSWGAQGWVDLRKLWFPPVSVDEPDEGEA